MAPNLRCLLLPKLYDIASVTYLTLAMQRGQWSHLSHIQLGITFHDALTFHNLLLALGSGEDVYDNNDDIMGV